MRVNLLFCGLRTVSFLALFSVFLTTGSESSADPTCTGFAFARDTFDFQNETYFTYDAQQRPIFKKRATGPGPNAYSRQCFTMARATIQFFKFARFNSQAPRVSKEELARRIRAVCRIPTWWRALPESKRIVIPGYSGLRQFSRSKPRLVQENIGLWWAGYLRFGNFRVPLPFPRAGQAEAARVLRQALQRGELQAIYMMRFTWLNHNLVLFDVRSLPDGNLEFLAYDPNLNDCPRILTFRPESSGFAFPKTFYFRGGAVNVFRTHISPFH